MSTFSQYKFFLSILVMFAAGATSGALIAWPAAKRAALPKHPSMERACDFMKHKLENRLHLTGLQMEKISPRMEQTERELDAVHEKSICEIEQVFQRANADISKELTSEQQPLLAEMEKERREFFDRHHPDSGPEHHHLDRRIFSDQTNSANYGSK